jgi:ElaB/YqjD/DUF883 family membrane-anchored ribosome-binding protein
MTEARMNRPSVGEQEGRSYGDERKGVWAREQVGRDETHPRIDLSRLREAGIRARRQLEEQVRKRPYTVLGATAGVGFVVGSVLGSRLGQVAVAAGIGYLAKSLLERDVVDRLRLQIEKLGQDRPRAAAGVGG